MKSTRIIVSTLAPYAIAIALALLIGNASAQIDRPTAGAEAAVEGDPTTTFVFYHQGPDIRVLPDGRHLNLNHVWIYDEDPSDPSRVVTVPQGVLPVDLATMNVWMSQVGRVRDDFAEPVLP